MEGRAIGYARVSTDDQNPALQTDALRMAGVADSDLYVEHISGVTEFALRTSLIEAIDACAPGDKLIVWKLDRLARSVWELINITKALDARGIHFECVQDKVDTSTPAGRFFFHVMAAVAEFERAMIVERTKAGLAAAERRGVRLGKPPWPHRDEAVRLIADGARVRTVARKLGCSESVIRKHCKGHLPRDLGRRAAA
ncbi:MAG: recombinase family protein [Pseudomonadota bacterium]